MNHRVSLYGKQPHREGVHDAGEQGTTGGMKVGLRSGWGGLGISGS